MWHVHTTEYVAFKKKEIVSYTTSWKNPEDNWGKWNKPVSKKTNIAWFHVHEVYKAVKLFETEKRMVVARG